MSITATSPCWTVSRLAQTAKRDLRRVSSTVQCIIDPSFCHRRMKKEEKGKRFCRQRYA